MTRGQALSAVVLVHLAVNLAHGRAHTGAQVPLPISGALFVYIIILGAPLLGLGLWRWRPRLGGWLVAASMCGALVFGLINHFMLDGPDHVGHVAAAWRQLFGITAVLLVMCEAAGTAVGIWAASPSQRSGLRGSTSEVPSQRSNPRGGAGAPRPDQQRRSS